MIKLEDKGEEREREGGGECGKIQLKDGLEGGGAPFGRMILRWGGIQLEVALRCGAGVQ